MSSAYHPQTDDQTEIVNRYLEDYLRCFAGDHPRTWYKLLPWAEWHYNTTFHFSIRMSPYQAVYGRPPPTLLDYMANTSSVDMVNTLLHDRTQALHLLKENLHRAQTRMKLLADAESTDVSFQIGDWVFFEITATPASVPLQPTHSQAI